MTTFNPLLRVPHNDPLQKEAWLEACRIVDWLRGEQPGCRVRAFGSLVRPGAWHPRSDIDLAIIGEGVTFDDILEIQDSLEQLGMLYRFDLQNLNAIHDTDVKDHIDRVGKIIYIKGVSSDTK